MRRDLEAVALNPRPYKLSRRRFVGVAAAAAAAAGASCGGGSSPWGFLTVNEARTLASICDQIIPADQDAGAAWAGVVNYIDRQLCGPFKDLRQVYRYGLAAVDKVSLSLYGRPFADAPPEKQSELLTMMEQGRAPGEAWRKIGSASFFGLLRDHTMQGFYGDPRHGGNHDRVSWKMLGLPYPPIRGRRQYDLTKTEPSGA